MIFKKQHPPSERMSEVGKNHQEFLPTWVKNRTSMAKCQLLAQQELKKMNDVVYPRSGDWF